MSSEAPFSGAADVFVTEDLPDSKARPMLVFHVVPHSAIFKPPAGYQTTALPLHCSALPPKARTPIADLADLDRPDRHRQHATAAASPYAHLCKPGSLPLSSAGSPTDFVTGGPDFSSFFSDQEVAPGVNPLVQLETASHLHVAEHKARAHPCPGETDAEILKEEGKPPPSGLPATLLPPDSSFPTRAQPHALPRVRPLPSS
jgi:hypothetical protein